MIERDYKMIDIKKRKNMREALNKSYSDEQLAIILWTLKGCPTGTVDEILEYNADDIIGACEDATGFMPE